jgi:rubrerythrin
MNLFEEAMTLEMAMVEYYETLREKCEVNCPIRKVLQLLAEDSEKEYRLLQLYNQKQKPQYSEKDFFLHAKDIFVSMQQQRNLGVCASDQLLLYENLLEKQKKTIVLYEQMLATATIPEQKEMLDLLIRGKRNHVLILETIVNLLLDPLQWVENGEFNHLEPY